jgi:hypothetical protein
MSGKNSRQRRKDAVNAARDAVYSSKGADYSDDMMPKNFDERQRRIFQKYYYQLLNQYNWFNTVEADMMRVYGHEQT